MAYLSADRLQNRHTLGATALQTEVVVVRSNSIFPQAESLKQHSLVLKTKPLVIRARAQLQLHSLVLKTPENISDLLDYL